MIGSNLLSLFNFALTTITVLAVVLVLVDQLYWKKNGEDIGYAVALSYDFLPILIAVIVIRTYIVEPFTIPSESMYSGLTNGDLITVTKASYDIKLPLSNISIYKIADPKRGDVAVFKFPLDPNTNYVKRVIGMPNDHLVWQGDDLFINGEKIQRQNKVNPQGKFAVRTSLETLNGKTYPIRRLSNDDSSRFTITSPYLLAKKTRQTGNLNTLDTPTDRLEITIPEHYYFMMGDNRDESSDSRTWGLVHREEFVGRADYLFAHLDQKTPIWKFWKKFQFDRTGEIN